MMMRRNVALFCAFLFAIIFLPYAQAQFVFLDEWYSSGSSFLLDSTLYGIDVSQDLSEVRITYNVSATTLLVGQCSQIGQYDFCINQTETRNISTYARLVLYEIKPIIAVAKSVETWDGYISETLDLRLYFNNSGTQGIELLYTESFPQNLQLRAVTPCQLTGNTVRFAAYLSINESTSCLVQLTAIGTGNASVSGTAVYGDDSTSSDAISISISEPFSVDISQDATVVSVDDGLNKTNVSYVFTGEIEDEVSYRFSFRLPDATSLLNEFSFFRQGDELVRYISLTNATIANVTLKLQSDQMVNATIEPVMKYTIDNRKYVSYLARSSVLFNFSSTNFLDNLPYLADIEPEKAVVLQLNSSNGTSLGLGQTTGLRFDINNSVRDANVTDIRLYAYIENKLIDYVYVTYLSPAMRVRSPYYNVGWYDFFGKTNVVYTVNGSAVVGGIPINISETMDISVEDTSDFTIESEPVGSIYRGESVDRTITINSPLTQPTYGRIFERVPPQIQVFGLLDSTRNFDPGDSTPLAYTLTVPSDYPYDNITLTTYFFTYFNGSEQNFSVQTTLDVEDPPYEPTVTVSGTEVVQRSKIQQLGLQVTNDADANKTLENLTLFLSGDDQVHFAQTQISVGDLAVGSSVTSYVYYRLLTNETSHSINTSRMAYTVDGARFSLQLSNISFSQTQLSSEKLFFVNREVSYDLSQKLHTVNLSFFNNQNETLDLYVPYIDAFSISNDTSVLSIQPKTSSSIVFSTVPYSEDMLDFFSYTYEDFTFFFSLVLPEVNYSYYVDLYTQIDAVAQEQVQNQNSLNENVTQESDQQSVDQSSETNSGPVKIVGKTSESSNYLPYVLGAAAAALVVLAGIAFLALRKH